MNDLTPEETPEVTGEVTTEVPCKTDPRAPHGFNRNASHSANRYVCECESWEPVDDVNMSQERVDETAKSEHEPVAWQVMVGDEALKEFPTKDMAHYWCAKRELAGSSCAYWIRPLYTAPPKKEWVGLTDEDKDAFWRADQMSAVEWNELFAAVEAKLKEKNGG